MVIPEDPLRPIPNHGLSQNDHDDHAGPVLEGAVLDRARWERPTRLPFLHRLDSPERAAFASAGVEAVFRPGQRLCTTNAADTDVIVILTGWAKVSLVVDGHDRIIAVRGPGDLVGERAALGAGGRSADVVALDEVVGWVIKAERFRSLINGYPRISQVLRRQELDRRAEEAHHAEPTHRIGVEQRLAGLLLEMAVCRGGRQQDGAVTITLPMSLQDLADWVDARPQDVEWHLRIWQRHRIIDVLDDRLVVVDAAGLERFCPPVHRAEPRRWPVASPIDAPLNHSIFFTDVAEFSHERRDDVDQALVRRELFTILQTAFGQSGIAWSECLHEDRGDGVLTVVPPVISTVLLVDPLLGRLTHALRRHNHVYGPPCQIQLRAALHVGPVAYDAGGVTGRAVIDAARMLDAPALKSALAESGADLGFIASSHVYDTVVRYRAGTVESGTYERVPVSVKETETTAWMLLAGAGVRV
jgi:CRP-like cAMP-binding protein